MGENSVSCYWKDLQSIFNSSESSSFFNIFLSVEVTWFYFALMMEKRPLSIDSKREQKYSQLSWAGSERETRRKARDYMHKDEFTQGYKTKNHLEWIDPIGQEHNFRHNDFLH